MHRRVDLLWPFPKEEVLELHFNQLHLTATNKNVLVKLPIVFVNLPTVSVKLPSADVK